MHLSDFVFFVYFFPAVNTVILCTIHILIANNFLDFSVLPSPEPMQEDAISIS